MANKADDLEMHALFFDRKNSTLYNLYRNIGHLYLDFFFMKYNSLRDSI